MSRIQFYTSPDSTRRAHDAVRQEQQAERRRKDPRPLSARLADAMIDMAGAGQTVDRDALLLRGFTRAELTDDNIAAARDRANRLVERAA